MRPVSANDLKGGACFDLFNLCSYFFNFLSHFSSYIHFSVSLSFQTFVLVLAIKGSVKLVNML